MAEELELQTNLTKYWMKVFIKVKFNKQHKDKYACFDATEKQQLMYEFLSKEIDFDYYTKVGIIQAHFPMHNRNTVQSIIDSMAKYKHKLLRSFIGDKY